jgi:hypothetical protein
VNDLANKIGDGNGPRVISAQPTTENVDVFREGEIVGLRIGNSVIRMKYPTAIKIGQWLMSRGVEAKFLASDTKRIIVERR